VCRSVTVVLGDRGEGGLGFPGEAGVGVAVAVFEDLDDPETGEVEVVAGVPSGRWGGLWSAKRNTKALSTPSNRMAASVTLPWKRFRNHGHGCAEEGAGILLR